MNKALLTVIALFLILLGPVLFSEGMFMDGLIYSSLSRNLAEGIGSIWQPFFSADYGAEFYGHPPLMFVLQASFFTLMGDYFWVERLFSLICSLLTIFGVYTAWSSLGGSSKNSWLPVFFWILMNEVVWACANNMLENTMTLFLVWFLVFYLRSLTENAYKVYFKVLAGLFIAFAFYTKGPVALFPLAFPFVLFITKKMSFRQMIFDGLTLCAVVLLAFLVPYNFSEAANTFWNKYWDVQILTGLGTAVTADSRWFILGAFVKGIAIPLVLCLLIMLKGKKAKILEFSSSKTAWFVPLFLLALCGVIPMMVSVKQRGFYILGVYPYVALSLALLADGGMSTLSNKLAKKNFFATAKNIILYLFLAIGLSLNLYFWAKPNRDKSKISDVQLISQVIEPRSSVGIPSSLRTDWSLVAYCQRMAKINLDNETAADRSWYLLKTSDPDLGADYELISLELQSYKLYKKIN